MKTIQINKDSPNYIHLFSGGLDSTYGLLRLAREFERDEIIQKFIQPIFIDYGQFAARTEWKQAQLITSFLTTKFREPTLIRKPVRMNLRSDLFSWCHNQAFTGKNIEEDACEIQNRNMVFLSIMFSYLMACAQNQGIKQARFEISSGFKEGEMKDCSTAFFNSLKSVFEIYNTDYSMKIALLPPMTLAQTHSDLRRLLHGVQSDLDQLLSITSSCYAPIDGQPCNSCYKCRIRKQDKKS